MIYTIYRFIANPDVGTQELKIRTFFVERVGPVGGLLPEQASHNSRVLQHMYNLILIYLGPKVC